MHPIVTCRYSNSSDQGEVTMLLLDAANRTAAALQSIGVGIAQPAPGGGNIDTDGILGFLASKIAPIFIAVVGIVMLGRANGGQVSRVLTSSAIALIGLVFVAGAATLFLFG